MNVPRLIGLHRGTSSLRAYLLADAETAIVVRCRPWDIMHTPPGGFAAAFHDTVGDWRAANRAVPAIASGLIGSSQGWAPARRDARRKVSDLAPPRWLYLKIDTDEGICGWGEPVLEGRAAAVAAEVEELADDVIGKGPIGSKTTGRCCTVAGSIAEAGST